MSTDKSIKGRSTVFATQKPADGSGIRRSGLRLEVNHHGAEVFGWYDSMVGIEPVEISLDDLEAALKNARRKR